MTLLVPIMLFNWPFLTILAFLLLRPHHAVLFSVLGGWLFLPMASYDLPGMPNYDKHFAIALGLLLGSFISGYKQMTSFQWKIYDIPIIIWCFCPFATSLSNKLGSYDGVAGVLNNVIVYGVVYLAGRMYFKDKETLQDLCRGIIIGGIIYLPFCIYEIRMSPYLHEVIYGFFQHSFDQHMRYGGFRPIVFIQHGLMVSLWMAVSTIITLWYWQSSEEKYLMGMPLSILFVLLVITTILCKSANGWTILLLGGGCYLVYMHANANSRLIFRSLILIIPIYIVIRITGMLPTSELLYIAGFIFDEQRVASLSYRLTQEDLICVEVLKRPILGWAGYDRGMPIDPETGQVLVAARDALWLITFQTYGFVGLSSLYTSLLLGPWLMINKAKHSILADMEFFSNLTIALSLSIVYFCIDTLLNGMVSPIYFIISGALLSFAIMKIGKPEKDQT